VDDTASAVPSRGGDTVAVGAILGPSRTEAASAEASFVWCGEGTVTEVEVRCVC
jgi:hypothetical protein